METREMVCDGSKPTSARRDERVEEKKEREDCAMDGIEKKGIMDPNKEACICNCIIDLSKALMPMIWVITRAFPSDRRLDELQRNYIVVCQFQLLQFTRIEEKQCCSRTFPEIVFAFFISSLLCGPPSKKKEHCVKEGLLTIRGWPELYSVHFISVVVWQSDRPFGLMDVLTDLTTNATSVGVECAHLIKHEREKAPYRNRIPPQFPFVLLELQVPFGGSRSLQMILPDNYHRTVLPQHFRLIASWSQ
ncbi:hypothetical protein KI387_036315, partial [Taxus chinensis]